jgi:hypothetical protein
LKKHIFLTSKRFVVYLKENGLVSVLEIVFWQVKRFIVYLRQNDFLFFDEIESKWFVIGINIFFDTSIVDICEKEFIFHIFLTSKRFVVYLKENGLVS